MVAMAAECVEGTATVATKMTTKMTTKVTTKVTTKLAKTDALA